MEGIHIHGNTKWRSEKRTLQVISLCIVTFCPSLFCFQDVQWLLELMSILEQVVELRSCHKSYLNMDYNWRFLGLRELFRIPWMFVPCQQIDASTMMCRKVYSFCTSLNHFCGFKYWTHWGLSQHMCETLKHFLICVWNPLWSVFRTGIMS